AAVAGRRLGARGDEPLDDAVLERMEADHRQPPARAQRVVGGAEAALEVLELAVDVDPDRLERARGRVDVATPARHHRGAQPGQFGGALERALAAADNDRARNAAAHALLATGPQHVGDLALVGAGQPLGRALARLGIHAHVQRAVLAEAEAAPGDVE